MNLIPHDKLKEINGCDGNDTEEAAADENRKSQVIERERQRNRKATPCTLLYKFLIVECGR